MNTLDKFGKFFVQNTRDQALLDYEKIIANKWKAPALIELQNEVSKMDADSKKIMSEVIDRIIITTMFNFLVSIQQSHDINEGIEVICDGESIAEISDGLHGELFSDEGWIKKYSRYEYHEKT